ncbi:MAG TPA: hypothetical protein VFG42_04525 [Baekduia sp.]|uniref:hypothetical protein n=1 Tax=Baekduia sp. TaxID=2600305 RepID=UPI002D79E287|nr:hypothetical protein [Baekduia sp.]HET6506031.1 hypothetical protein [Baekduia sp.]
MSKPHPSEGSSDPIVTLVLKDYRPVRMTLVRDLVHLAEVIVQIVNRHRLKPLDSYQQGVLETTVESASVLVDAIKAIDSYNQRR